MASVDQPFQTDPNSGDQNNQAGGSQSTSNSSINPPQTQIASGTGTVGGGPGSSQGPGQNAGGAAGPQGGSANSSTGTTSGAYPNLSKYMAANENWTNSSGQGLGQEVAGNLNNQGNQVNQNIQNAQNSFQNQGTNWENNTQQAESGFQSGLANPYAYTQGGSANMQQANEALNASYKGPQNLFGNNPNLQQQTQNYVTQAGQTQTAAGQQNLLAQQFGGQGNYTQGQQTLDQSLLQTNPNSQQALTQANQKAIQTNQNLQNTNTQDQSQANAWTQYGQQAQQAALGALNSSIGGLGSTLQNQYQTAQQTAPQELAAAQAAINSGNITAAQAAALGITNGEYFYNVNPGQYATQANITQQNTATQDQYNQMLALAQLGGLNSAGINPASSGYLQTYSAANQPGQFLTPGNYVNYNQAALQSAITNAANAYNSQAQQYVNPIEQNMGAYYSNVISNNPGMEFNPYQGNVWTGPTGVGLNTNTITATGSPVQTILGPENYANLANQLLQTGENKVLANGPAGTQVADHLAEGQTQGYAGNYNSGQSLAYLNALSALMGLNQSYDAANQFNIGS